MNTSIVIVKIDRVQVNFQICMIITEAIIIQNWSLCKSCMKTTYK